MQHLRLIILASLPCLAVFTLPACDGDDGSDTAGNETMGDGDGDPTTGDGDGDGDPTTGDGDGDPTTGDGDGDPTTGDGDGDGDPTTGDGDGDPGFGFETDVYPIIASSCSCHLSVVGAGGLGMPDAGTAYANLIDVASVGDGNLNRVTAGDPDNSVLYQKLTGTQNVGAQMPLNGMALVGTDVQTVNDWITQGAAP